jgi:hypothetical protein
MSSKSKIPSRVPRNASDSQVGAVAPIVAKVAGESSGFPFVGPLVGALADLIEEHISRTSEAMRREQEQRLADFYADVLDAEAKMDEQVASAMIDDKDFHALLRACVADIEAEKVRAYANLARGIASGAVAQQWRRHFILSLRDLSADEIECLRRALVAHRNQLIPPHGPPSMGPGNFLRDGEPGTPQAIWMSNLAGRGLIHDKKLSPAGEAFTQACYQSKDLTPASIGFRVWSGHNIAIVNYEIGEGALYSLCENLQHALRAIGVKSTVMAVVRDNEQQARLLFTMGIVVAREGTKWLSENLPALSTFAAKVPTMLVSFGDLPEAADVPLFERLDASTMERPAILDEIRRAVLDQSRQMAAASPGGPD